MKQNILNQIKAKVKESGGHNGIKITEFGYDFNEVKKILKVLNKENKISVREGVNQWLIYLKK
ncbi:MAG: hypothetical protein KGV59_06260 [Tenacibaculum sp.]|nr:hypothetical protein [Tenacibaculum sp.]